MGSVATWVNDTKNTKTIDLLVDETYINLKTRSPILNYALPIQEFSSRDFLSLLFDDVNPVADLIGFGQEIPTTGFGGFEKVNAEMCKIGVATMYDENIQWQMLEAMKYANMSNVDVQDSRGADGNVTRGSNNDLAMRIYGGIQKLVKSVMDRFDAMRWQALYSGMVNVVSTRTNISANLNFKDPEFGASLFPNPCVPNGVGVDPWDVVWSDYTNANGIQTIWRLVNNYIDVNGFPPDKIVLSRDLYNHLLQQKSTKDSVTSFGYPQVGTVSPDLLDKVMEARRLPKLEEVNDMYQYTDPTDGNIKRTRFVPNNVILLIKEKVGVSAIGTTMESVSSPVSNGADLSKLNPKSGIYTTTYEKSKNPIIDASFCVMTCLPIIQRKKLISARVVN